VKVQTQPEPIDPYVAPLSVVEDFAKKIDEQQLECRVDRHRYDKPLTGGYNPELRAIVVRKQCACGVIRYREHNRSTFEVERTELDYSEAPDYLLVGHGRISGRGKGVLFGRKLREEFGLTEKQIEAADRKYAKTHKEP